MALAVGAFVPADHAGVELECEHDEPVLIDQLRQATLALTQTTPTAEDRMLVPEALSESIRHLFAMFLIARACERRYDHE